VHDRLYLVDLTNLIYRFFFAFIRNPLRNSSGFNTSAIFGVSSFIRETVRENDAKFMACAVDLKKKTFRHEIFADYKSGRQETPDELILQIEPVYEALRMMGIPVLSSEGFEADDVIGTLARKFRDDFEKIMIVTSDKDMGQLIDEKTFILYPKKENGSYPLLDGNGIEEKLGVKREQITDYFALVGDAVDAVPGIEGIGPKTAEKLLREAASVEDMAEHPEKIKNEKLRQKISERREELMLYKRLVTISTDAPVGAEIDDLRIKPTDENGLNDFFAKYELFSLMKEHANSNHEERTIEESSSAEEAISGEESAVLFLRGDELFIGSGNRMHRGKRSELNSSLIKELKKRRVITNNIKSEKELHPLIGETELLDVSLISQMQSRHGGLDRIVREYSGANYAGGDSAEEEFCKHSKRFEDEALADANYAVYRDIELPIIPAISSMEENGITADREFFLEERQNLINRLSEKEREIYGLAGCRFNVNSPKQVGEVLFEKMKIKSGRKTKTGYSTDSSVLESLKQEHRIAEELLSFRENSKLLSGFIEPILQITENDPVVHTTFEQSFAATGRFSSRNPNMQNIPAYVRRGFTVRRSDNVLLSTDYSQIELRVLAILSRDKNLLAAFREERDIHLTTAMKIFRADENSVTEKMRSLAKVVNFSVLYGKTPFGLSQELSIPRREAERFIDSYFEEFGGVREWIEKTKEETRRAGFAKTLFGRVRVIPEINSSNKTVREQAERSAVNMPVQGTAADIIKLAMRKVYEKIRGEKDIMMILTIHDELVFEVKGSECSHYREIIEKEMSDIEGMEGILRVKSNEGKRWSDV